MRLRWLFFFILLIGLIGLQTTVLNIFSIGGVKPNLILIFLIALMLWFGFTPSVFFIISGGILLDLFSGAPFGLNSFALLLTSFLVAKIVFSAKANKIDWRKITLAGFWSSFSYPLFLAAIVFVHSLLTAAIPFFNLNYFIKHLFGLEVIYNALLFFAVVNLANFLIDFLRKQGIVYKPL